MISISMERLEFKELSMNYTEKLFEIWKNDDVVKYTYVGKITTIDDCNQRITNILTKWKNPKDIGPYVVFYESEVIGFAGGVHKSDVFGEYELFYHFDKKFWGKGFATETAKRLLEETFSIPTVQRVSAEAVVENQSSWRVLEKVGMKREGCLRRKFFDGKEYYDLYVYSILKNEYIK